MVLLAALLAAVGFLGKLNHTLESNVSRASLLPAQSMANAANSKGERNIVLIVKNEAGNLVAAGLAEVNAERSKLGVTYYGKSTMVGDQTVAEAYSDGGAQALVTAIEQAAGVSVHHATVSSVVNFARMTDAIGGITVNGQWMDGQRVAQAIKDSGEDPELLTSVAKAIASKAFSRASLTNPARVDAFTDAATKGLIVDEHMTTGELRSLVVSMRNIGANDVTFTSA